MQPDSDLEASLDPRLPRRGDVVAGKYRIDGFIARGGMGAVVSASHLVTGRRMALKWLLYDPGQDAEATHRLIREAQAAARVRHPNVVDVYDVGEHDGSLFLVMELLEGETLAALLKARGVLGAHATLELLLPAMRGVEAAHRSHVVHRDLKPSNIFLSREPDTQELTTRVLDFGVSKVLASAGDGVRSLTQTGAVVGTPHYMAPEQLTSGSVDERADIYALGVILYQCLSGRLPFQQTNYNALVVQIATTVPEPLQRLRPHLPKGLPAVVMRAMAQDPALRFQRVGELIDALTPFCSNAKLTSERPKRAALSARRLWLAIVTGALVSLLAWAALRRSGQPATISGDTLDAARDAQASPQPQPQPLPAVPAVAPAKVAPVQLLAPATTATAPNAAPKPETPATPNDGSSAGAAPTRAATPQRRASEARRSAKAAASRPEPSAPPLPAPPIRPVPISPEQF